MGVKKFLEVKSLFFVKHLGCVFVKIKVAFVDESYTLVSQNQNIQIYFAPLQLDARLDAAAKPKRMLESTGKETVRQKFWGTVGHSCYRPIIIIS